MPRPSKPIPQQATGEFTLIMKMVGSRTWKQVSNPLWHEPHAEGYAAIMLKNWAIEYVEWVNSGKISRVIRSHNLDAYKLE
jgi:hypothetical protein